jgi:hypothetical protein
MCQNQVTWLLFVLQVHHVRLRDNAIGILDKTKSDHVQSLNTLRRGSTQCLDRPLLEASPDRHGLILKSKEVGIRKVAARFVRATMTQCQLYVGTWLPTSTKAGMFPREVHQHG